ncbi:hypothetical protein BDZ90DRAFT_92408 [Jaminaea rosea]|uniref:Uncharacterized protein n=1 Tax=Jaminaea rosea TaxID=1569628 RepID=A0A316UI66_9BASI|nr:hypothetical protein BDZ90DRAFT_92408 [Jaminaea rosea]PWN25037.1 hypothetical protein BDZ90DRAFT_92408 [Jaminaea rosea]
MTYYSEEFLAEAAEYSMTAEEYARELQMMEETDRAWDEEEREEWEENARLIALDNGEEESEESEEEAQQASLQHVWLHEGGEWTEVERENFVRAAEVATRSSPCAVASLLVISDEAGWDAFEPTTSQVVEQGGSRGREEGQEGQGGGNDRSSDIVGRGRGGSIAELPSSPRRSPATPLFSSEVELDVTLVPLQTPWRLEVEGWNRQASEPASESEAPSGGGPGQWRWVRQFCYSLHGCTPVPIGT